MGTVGMQGPFQPQILGGTQQLFFVEISEAANPPPPRSASYSLTHSIAWVNSDSSAQAAPLPWVTPAPTQAWPLPKPLCPPCSNAPSSSLLLVGKAKGRDGPV